MSLSKSKYESILEKFENMKFLKISGLPQEANMKIQGSSPQEASGLTPSEFEDLPIFSESDEGRITRFPFSETISSVAPQVPQFDLGEFGEFDEYATEIINNLHNKQESQRLNSEDYIIFREKLSTKQYQMLISWLYDVQHAGRINIKDETLFATFICILKCFSSPLFVDLDRNEFQLVGITCLRLMMKVYQRQEILSFAVYICDGAYTKRQINRMEVRILETIGFVSEIVTVYSWMEILSNYFSEEVTRMNAKIQNYPFLFFSYLPSQILCGIIFSVSESVPNFVLNVCRCDLDTSVIIGAQIDDQKPPSLRSYQLEH
ncbi:MAG: hypothetical protein Solivirus2_43 [Solivirus sp.]|uniref:Cyclin N-terminal domain-containing protein n=1 Tax=Solivirus sp. TaxID=2487772 RepID=A0A3G5AFM0_9VIRU|nr:MAG: hypothetical protein Solivirus2_43 [Solivirus sp.]